MKVQTIMTVLCFVLFSAMGAVAQSMGTIEGKVINEATGDVMPGVNVALAGTSKGAATDESGTYEITGVEPGTYEVKASYLGYSTFESDPLDIAAGETVTQNITLNETVSRGNEVVISATKGRKAEKITDAPATIEVVDDEQLSQLATFNTGELLSRLKGVDYVRTGVYGTGINVRGFNSAFNTKVLQMTDGRLSTLIATELPFGLMEPKIKEDIDRTEVILGPSAALYGPNAHNGLINTISKDPRETEGITGVIGAGSQDQFSGRFRYAEEIFDGVALKLTGGYTQGKEFAYTDTVYFTNTAPSDFSGGANPPTEHASPEIGLDRDFDVLKGEAGLYFDVGNDSDIILNYGGSNSNYIGATNAGRNSIKDWQVHYVQGQYSSQNLYMQVDHTWSNTDDTFAMNQRTQNYLTFMDAGFSEEEALERSFTEQWFGTTPDNGTALPRGAVFKDDSRRLASELQYNNNIGNFNYIVGVQYQRDMANSKGSYLLDNNGESDIVIDQIGLSMQLEKTLGFGGLKATFAARGDNHDKYGFNFIPKAGLLRVGEEGTWRLTYGKGIAAPTILNMETNMFGGIVLGNGEGFTLSDGSEVDAIDVETIQTLELGYKGTPSSNFFVDANAYYNFSENFLSPLANIAPEGLTGGPVVTKRGDQPIGELQGGIAQPGDYVLTYLNYGKVNTYGFDLGFNYYINDDINISANYSYFNYSLDTNDLDNDANGDGEVEATDLPINTPENKVNLGLNVNKDKFFGSIFGRWVQSYNFFSGINIASETNQDITVTGDPVVENAKVGRDWNEGPLGGFINVDISGGYNINDNLTLSAQLTNVFNSEVREFVASPTIRRMAMVELKASF
ncbi:MAG: TonB-dependent receptor [Bacteroidota bacterium]